MPVLIYTAMKRSKTSRAAPGVREKKAHAPRPINRMKHGRATKSESKKNWFPIYFLK